MPENSLTGWKRRITAYCEEHQIEKSTSAISRMAVKINKRFETYTQFVDVDDDAVFEMGLRILGIHRDETPRMAILGH